MPHPPAKRYIQDMRDPGDTTPTPPGALGETVSTEPPAGHPTVASGDHKPDALPEKSAGVEAYTPALLLEAVQAVLLRRDPGTVRVTHLRAIPMRNRETAYGGYAYVQLRDPHANASVEGRIPVSLVPQVEWGRETLFSGLVDYRVAGDRVTVQFTAGTIEGVSQAQQLTKEALRKAWLHAITRPKPDPQAALAGDRPRIAIVTATTGVAMDDIRRQLQEAEADVEIATFAVPMNQPERVARAIHEAAQAADLVVLTRGGGTGVDDLDADQVIEAIASCPVATIAAVGHASDVLVVEQVASRAFATPTHFGMWLRTALQQKRALAAQAEQARQIREQVDLAKTNRELTETNTRLTASVTGLTKDTEALRLEANRLRIINRWLGLGVALALATALGIFLLFK